MTQVSLFVLGSNSPRAYFHLIRLAVAIGFSQHLGKVLQERSDVGMLAAVGPFLNRYRALEERLSLLIPFLLFINHGQIIDVFGSFRMFVASEFVSNRKRSLEKGFRLYIAAL